MKKSRFMEEQITYALRQAEAGTPVADVCRQLGVSEATGPTSEHTGVQVMRVLYLIYGEQSGVIKFLSNTLTQYGVSCSTFDPRGRLTYRHRKYKIPSVRPSNLLNMARSVRQFGHSWKEGFFRTDYAFQLMTKTVRRYVQNHHDSFDLVLQSGCLFSAGNDKPPKPYFLYLDNTTAIHENPRYKKGLMTSTVTSANWKNMEKATYHAADRIFTMSRFVKDSLVNDYGISPRKIRVIGAGPNLESLPQIDQKSYASRTLLFVGKEFSRKGGAVLLKAFEKVRKEFPDARLVMVGPSEIIEGPGIVNKGFVDFSEMPAFYADASVFVLPTLREPFGLSFLEAMAYRIPCVGTNIQAIPEIIDDGETGFLVPPFDHEALAQKIIVLLKDEQLMKRMGERGFEKVSTFYTWDRVARSIIKEFNDFPDPRPMKYFAPNSGLQDI